MRGREIFALVRPVFRVLQGILSLVPRPVCRLALRLCRNTPFRIGIACRYLLVSRLARSCGDNLAIFEGVYLFRPENMSIGQNVSIHPMSYVDATGGLAIGSDVSIAHAVTVMTTEHDYTGPGPIRDAPGTMHAVEIGDDVWIGAGARILAGVRIGSHSVVAAGAVVTKDVGPNELVAGVPAKLLKPIRVCG